MAETEVESILREIRERVVAQQNAVNSSLSSSNGGGESRLEPSSTGAPATENLALIKSHLATTGRAWDRLPPLLSNRSGFSARVELWLKRHIKRATRWYAWEQVNFNAAVHHALSEILSTLSSYSDELQRLRTRIDATEAKHRALEESQTELAAQLSAQAATQSASLQREAAAQRQVTDALKTQTDQRFAQVESELRERIASLLDEQRVCLRQLSLETSEAAVLEDRARRQLDISLKEIEKRVEQLETPE